ncbi:MAG: B12-binding domain-containing radical SAM protein, partial [Thermoguttaceae bacterium]
MRVLLISPNTERINMPTLPLGLALVATATRRVGHQTRFLDLLRAQEPMAAVRRVIDEFQPTVIALSIRNVDDQSMQDTKFLLEPARDVVAACRAASLAKIVVGGAGYSIFPTAALTYLDADYGVCGEGEVVFPMLLERLQRGQDVVGLPGLYVRGGHPPTTRGFAEDLDLLPMAEAELWTSANPEDPEVWVPVQTRRGCPLACSYCSTPELEGTQVRMRSPLLVIEHIAQVVKAGFRRLYFVGAECDVSLWRRERRRPGMRVIVAVKRAAPPGASGSGGPTAAS